MKMKGIHGGDIYRNYVKIDFSVNVNPLGIPDAVEAALHEAVENCSRYPDISAEKLKKAVSGMLTVLKEYLLFGNGASELFMAIIHGIKPKKMVYSPYIFVLYCPYAIPNIRFLYYFSKITCVSGKLNP